jgi:sorbitol-specific phosphotransferase system component IIC
LTLCGIVPILGMLCVVVNFVIALMMISRICDAVNALADAPRPPAAAPAG